MVKITYTDAVESWGRLPRARACHSIRRVNWRNCELPSPHQPASVLPYGQGRSYGDSCLNDGGTLLVTHGLDRFIAFDGHTGILCCEAGVTLEEILRLVMPRGWFLPVTPGTKFVSVGGAIANDVHGKNHHRAGTFGRFVTQFELLRSNGERLLCSPTQNADWYRATIGGLGLTGLIPWAEIQLKPINNPLIQMETIRLDNLDDFFAVSADSDASYEYTVAWIDCLATGRSLGRGLFMRGNHAAPQLETPMTLPRKRKLAMPFEAPEFLLNTLSLKAFNSLFYHKQRRERVERLVHYEPFFYPLDAIHNWNRLYGRRGFYQYQCTVPYSGTSSSIRHILEMIAEAKTGSFLAVLKVFGHVPSPGMMSFPKPGVTLALDFPNAGRPLLELFERLDRIVRDNGGAVYPAKDARMSAVSFQTFFPMWREFAAYVDPKFSSSFWRRVTPTE